MIFCLIASGLLAVTTVLTGSFNDTFAKALTTILIIAAHSLVSFSYIGFNEKNKSENDLSFFHNSTFIIIILSFITATFGVWKIIDGDLVLKLYSTYLVILFAILHGETLYKMKGNETNTDLVIKTNYFFMVIVVLMIMPVIYISNSESLGDIYYRILAAAGIIDTVLTLVAIILNKIYLQKHPKVDSALYGSGISGNSTVSTEPSGQPAGNALTVQPKKHMNIFVTLLLGYLAIQLVAGLIIMVIGRQVTNNAKTTEINKPASSETSPPVVTPEPKPDYDNANRVVYVYESQFKYNTKNYTCTKKIAGTWIRQESTTTNINTEGSFSFNPANQYDLSRYCSITQ